MIVWPHDPDVQFLSDYRAKELASWERRFPKRDEMRDRGNVTWFDGFAGRAQGLAALTWGLDGDLSGCRRWLERSAEMAKQALAMAPPRNAPEWASRATLGLILNDRDLLDAVGRFDAAVYGSDDWDPNHPLSLAIESVDAVRTGERSRMIGIATRWESALRSPDTEPSTVEMHRGLPGLLQAAATGDEIETAIRRRGDGIAAARSNRIDRRRPIVFLDTQGLRYLTVARPLPTGVADLSPYLPTALLETESD